MDKMKRSLSHVENGKSNIFGHIAVTYCRKIWQIILHIFTFVMPHMVSIACNVLHDGSYLLSKI